MKQNAFKSTKKDRLQIRVGTQEKELIQKASDYTHRNISDFVLGYALEAAEDIVSAQEHVVLSNNDWSIFYDALVDVESPNSKLKNAMKFYRQQKGQ
jgi:uncharacterized protein (DUF1778 family)